MEKNPTSIFDEIVGWYGLIAIILAYALVSYNFLLSSGMTYQMLNITGAIGIIWISYKKKVYQSVTLNIIWAIIGLIAIIRLFL
jgi:hypothetical protein